MSMSNVSRCILCLSFILKVSTTYKINYEWVQSRSWSPCSETCGIGTQHILLFCSRKTIIGTNEKVENFKCLKTQKPENVVVRTCFLGKCPTRETSEFIWKVGNWSSCSNSCGGSGVKTREIQCILALTNGNHIEAKYQNCNLDHEPVRSDICGYSDCPPEYLKTPWNKCSKLKGCKPRIRRRVIACAAMLRTGLLKTLAIGICYRLSKPPPAWEQCPIDHINEINCRYKNSMNELSAPKISNNDNKIHQMRPIKTLRLAVGQTAYVLPHTRLIIKCPVKHYPRRDLQWKKHNETYLKTKNKENRIFVNPKGYLIIKNFLPSDTGFWKCIARDVSAKVLLIIENPSIGFSEWLSRKIYFKQKVVWGKNNFAITYAKTASYHWVVSQWSPCTKSCDTDRMQNRTVNCELIEPRYFVVVNEDKCQKEGIPKPILVRNCAITSKCPHWSIDKTNTNKCSNTCIDIGIAVQELNLSCKYENRNLPLSSCDQNSRPLPRCSNSKCSVYWKVGSWSKCSISCGSAGFSFRTISCRWKTNDLNAQDFCIKMKIELPVLTKTCQPPPCNLGCLDLSKFCGIKRLCRLSHYQYTCCKTCISMK